MEIQNKIINKSQVISNIDGKTASLQLYLSFFKLELFFQIKKVKNIANCFKEIQIKCIKQNKKLSNMTIIKQQRSCLLEQKQQNKGSLTKSFSLNVKNINRDKEISCHSSRQNLKQQLKQVEKRLRSNSISDKSEKSTQKNKKVELIKQISQRLINMPKVQFLKNTNNLVNLNNRSSRLQNFLNKIKRQKNQYEKSIIMIKKDKIQQKMAKSPQDKLSFLNKSQNIKKQVTKTKQNDKEDNHSSSQKPNGYTHSVKEDKKDENNENNDRHKDILQNLISFKKDLKQIRNTNNKLLQNIQTQNHRAQKNSDYSFNNKQKSPSKDIFLPEEKKQIQNDKSSPVQYFTQINQVQAIASPFQYQQNKISHRQNNSSSMMVQNLSTIRHNKIIDNNHYLSANQYIVPQNRGSQKPKINFIKNTINIQSIPILSINNSKRSTYH